MHGVDTNTHMVSNPGKAYLGNSQLVNLCSRMVLFNIVLVPRETACAPTRDGENAVSMDSYF